MKGNRPQETSAEGQWHIEPVFQTSNDKFVWRWRKVQSHGKPQVSRSTFEYYYDCVQDAREHGYTPAEPVVMRF